MKIIVTASDWDNYARMVESALQVKQNVQAQRVRSEQWGKRSALVSTVREIWVEDQVKKTKHWFVWKQLQLPVL